MEQGFRLICNQCGEELQINSKAKILPEGNKLHLSVLFLTEEIAISCKCGNNFKGNY